MQVSSSARRLSEFEADLLSVMNQVARIWRATDKNQVGVSDRFRASLSIVQKLFTGARIFPVLVRFRSP